MAQADHRIFITGATGFLGSWIVARLAARGVEVIATDVRDDRRRLMQVCPGLPAEQVGFHTCDVTDAEAVDALIARTRPTCIVHLAALQIPECRAMPARGVAINIGGHVNILEAARRHGTGRVLYTSSIAAKPRGPANGPANLYGVFKKTDEEIARIYWQEHGLRSLGLRPYMVYGVGRDDGETSVITRAIEAAALGRPYEIPFATRGCFQFAGDVAEVFARVALATWDGALLSDVSDRVHSTADVVQSIRAVVPGADITCAGTERVSPDGGFETSVLAGIIGEIPEHTLTEGICETVRHFRELAGQ